VGKAKLEVYPEPVEGPAQSLSMGFVTGPQGCGRYVAPANEPRRESKVVAGSWAVTRMFQSRPRVTERRFPTAIGSPDKHPLVDSPEW